jgi:hypothetical protein
MASSYCKASILMLLLVFSVTVQAQVKRQNQATKTQIQISQCEVLDLVFEANVPKDINPFDIKFSAAISGPDGQILEVPGFYNGGKEWILRFSGSKAGKWTYLTHASLPQLSGQKGTLTVTPNKVGKGAVQVDPENPQAFIHEDGSPHFMLAFELDWLFALDYNNPAGLPKSESILQHVADNGFNHVVMNVYAYDVGWGISADVPEKYFFGKPNYSPFMGSNDSPDFSRLNVQLFQHLDRVIALMQQKGLDAHLMIYVWNKKVNWPEMYSRADNMYFDYIIARYQGFSNVIWDVSKEALDYGRCDIPYINERISRIRKNDAYNRLLTVHDYEYNSREASRVDFISIQSWRSNLYSLMLQGRERHLDKPVVNIEHGGYESGPYRSFVGNYTTAETCLERTYECVFAGVYGSYYWQNAAWNIVIYDPFDQKHSFDPPKFVYYSHMAALFAKYPLNNFKPSIPKLTTNDKGGENNLATNGYALYDAKGSYLMLIPAASDRVNLVIPKPEGGTVQYTWFNPFTGEYKRLAAKPWSSWQEMISPWPDIFSVLIIETGQK